MAPKRKAAAAAAVDGRAPKRVASGVSTPASMGSDDEYSDSDGYQSSNQEKEREAVAAAPKYDS